MGLWTLPIAKHSLDAEALRLYVVEKLADQHMLSSSCDSILLDEQLLTKESLKS